MTLLPSRVAPVVDRAWHRARRAGRRWATWGALFGFALGGLLFAPATWLAAAVGQASGEHLLLADAQGSVWTGNALLVLAGGPGSRASATLPGRLHWRLRPHWRGLRLSARHACCLNGELQAQLRVGLGSLELALPARAEALGQWPAQWLAGLGTPWNTLQLGGMLRASSPGLSLRRAGGQTRLTGAFDLDLIDARSRLSSLEPLGNYRVSVRGNAGAAAAAADGAGATLTLQTLEGALRLSGSGDWSGERLRFRGQAQAADGQESALANLLNIIGRRQGALSVISIG